MGDRNLAVGLSAAGLSLQSVAAEVLLFLPREFVAAYEELWMKGYGAEVKDRGDSERVKAKRRDGRITSNGSDTMAPAKSGKKTGANRTPLKDERALATKQRVDRKLRRIARELRSEERVNPRRCTKHSCRKWAEPEWLFCPYDGSPTENVD